MGEIMGRRGRRGRGECELSMALDMAEAAEIIVSEARGETRERKRRRVGDRLLFFAGMLVGGAVSLLLSGGAFALWLLLT